MGRTHPKHKTPHVAVITQGAIALAIVLAFSSPTGPALDVYWIAVQGVIWIVLVQALTSLSVWAYFRKLPPEERSFWKTTVVPGSASSRSPGALPLLQVPELARGRRRVYVKELGQIGRGAASRSTSPGSASSACSSLAALFYALWLRSANREKYDRAGRFINEGELA